MAVLDGMVTAGGSLGHFRGILRRNVLNCVLEGRVKLRELGEFSLHATEDLEKDYKADDPDAKADE